MPATPPEQVKLGYTYFQTLIFGSVFLVLRFGVPAGLEMFLGVTAFNWDIVAFIPMIGMGHAATALVGQNIGAGDFAESKESTYTALKVSWVYSFSMVFLFVFGSRMLVGAFASGFEGDTDSITSLATAMVRLASLYTLADSAQLVFTGALRGAGDTKWIMRMSVALHWAFAILAIIMIRVIKVPPIAGWLLLILFVIGLGITMFLRFRGEKWRDIELIQRDNREQPTGTPVGIE